MKRQMLIAIIIVLLVACKESSRDKALNLNVATYNIRFDSPSDSGNMWSDRAAHVMALIRYHQFDIVGTQEGMHHQLEQMREGLKMPYIGVGRDEGSQKGEFCAIFYNPDRLKPTMSGTFWLSETPDLPSKGWDAALNRICTWARFQDKLGKEFYVFNAHYDHIGQQAREESSRLIIAKIKSINDENLPIILLGDFNITSENTAYSELLGEKLLEDARGISQLAPYGPQGTFNGFNWNNEPKDIIDHVFVSQGIVIHRHAILSDNYGLKYASDHFPVAVNLSISP